MTTAPPSTQPSGSDWRGVAAESMDDVPQKTSLLLRDRSRRLLGSLLRPHRRVLAVVLGVVLVENAARLAIPFLVAVGIDRGIPPMQAGEGSQVLSRSPRSCWRWWRCRPCPGRCSSP